MSFPDQTRQLPPEAARAVLRGNLLDFPGACPGCGGPLKGRQKTCSGKCRAAVSRRKQAAAQAERERQIRELLQAALLLLDPGEEDHKAMKGYSQRLPLASPPSDHDG